ncbi:hypothetical protein Leryth_015756 [Lithospermum erythrorhizon]|nr:hypothetical protein Leryth_015756 [Lithospermum erythrorhizon]
MKRKMRKIGAVMMRMMTWMNKMGSLFILLVNPIGKSKRRLIWRLGCLKLSKFILLPNCEEYTAILCYMD